MAARQGLWVFYNQAEGLDWPTRRDGPFRGAWAHAGVDSRSFYGRVLTTGGATGARGSGVPFAIVATAAPTSLTASEHPLGYRYVLRGRNSVGESTYSWTPYPHAAYCWAEGVLNDRALPSGRPLVLLDLTAAGGEFIVRALLRLAWYIEDEVHRQAMVEGRIRRREAARRREVRRQLTHVLQRG